MAYLVEQLFGWLLIVGLLCALSGWAWHLIRNAAEVERLERDRQRLRHELVQISVQGIPEGDGPLTREFERELDTLRTRESVAVSRVAELERMLAAQRDNSENHVGRIAELERALESRAAPRELEPDFEPIEPTEDERRAFWRRQYNEARLAFLEGEGKPTPGVDPQEHALVQAALAGAQRDLSDERTSAQLVRARVTELEAEIARLRAQPQGADPAPFTAEINRQQWQIRYLEARVAYLEGQIRAVPAPVVAPEPAEEDREAKARADWRMRYLEARVAHLQGQPKADPAPMQARVAELEAALAAVRSDAQARIARAIELEAALRDAQSQLQAVPALRQRIGELTSALEAARAQPVETEEMRRARWRARYLASRVRHLEELRVRAPAAPQPRAAAQPVSTPVMEEPPLVPPGGEVRPEALPAPRAGVPDDLRLIDGVGPKIESTLNSLGVYHFDQIGAWTPANIAWVDQYLRFRGRIVREQWVEQARRLAANGGVGARALADELG